MTRPRPAPTTTREEAEDAIRVLLRFVGERADRDGLKDTPARVIRAWEELTDGYRMDPAAILRTRFDCTYDEIVVVRNIEFTSTCEHHLLPFLGTAAIAYLPRRGVVGISKLARLVQVYARRLQIQEQLTHQIAQAITRYVRPRGAAVILTAHHACMGCRGVRQPRSEMVTSVLTGIFRRDRAARAECLRLMGGTRHG